MTLKDLLSKLLKSNECLLTLIESSMISYPWKQFFFQQLLDFNSGLFLTIYSRLSFLFFQQNQSLPIQKDFLDIIQPIFDIFSESYKPVISDEREFKRDRLGLLSKTKSDMAILFDVYEVHNNQLELKNRLKKASKDVEINRSQANHIRLARLGAKGRG